MEESALNKNNGWKSHKANPNQGGVEQGLQVMVNGLFVCKHSVLWMVLKGLTTITTSPDLGQCCLLLETRISSQIIEASREAYKIEIYDQYKRKGDDWSYKRIMFS